MGLKLNNDIGPGLEPDQYNKINNEEDKILTVKDIGNYLKFSKSTVYKLISEDNLPATKIGGTWIIRKSKLNKWLDEREYRPANRN